jgi:hypothetical protein
MSILKINVLPKVLENPVVDAGPNVTIYLPETSVNITAVAVDDGTIVSYQWSTLNATSPFILSNTAQPTVTASSLLPGTYELKIVVTDDDGLTGEDTVMITVIDPNTPPISNPGAPQILNIGYINGQLDPNYDVSAISGGYRFKLSSTKVQQLLQLYQSDGNNGMEVKVRKTNTIVGGPDIAYHIAQILNIALIGSTPTGIVDLSFSDSFNPITPPTLGTVGIGNQSNLQLVFKTTHAILDGSNSSDPQGGALTYLWTLVDFLGGTGPNTSVIATPTQAITKVRSITQTGVCTYNLKVTDPELLQDIDSTTLTVTSTTGGSENPVITTIGGITDEGDNQVGLLVEGAILDLNGFGTILSVKTDIFQIAEEDSTVKLKLISLNGTVVFESEQNISGSGEVILELDLSDVPIGTVNQKLSYTVVITVTDDQGREDERYIPIKIYNSQSTGTSTIIVEEESSSDAGTIRVVTVTVPAGESRVVEGIMTDVSECTIDPAVGTITEDTEYTMTITGPYGVNSIILRSKKDGVVEASTQLNR